MDKTLTKDDINDIVIGLTMRINLIQTGDPNMSSDTAQKSGNSHKIKALSDEQMMALLRMKGTIKTLVNLSGEVRLIEIDKYFKK